MKLAIPTIGFALVVLSLSSPGAVHAGGPDAETIMRRVLARGTFGWDGARTRVRMVLEDRSGRTKERRMIILGRREGDRLESLVRFVAPEDVAGMAFLMRQRESGRSEQYVYLPRLNRTRRVAGREREGSFMGSDLSYADLERRDLQGARHTRLDDAKVGSHEAFVVRSVPQNEDTQYAKIESWIRKSDFVPLRTRFYDTDGKLLKTLYTRKVREIDGRPVVMRARVHNHQNGHVTVLVVESIEQQESFPSGTFTRTALQRG